MKTVVLRQLVQCDREQQMQLLEIRNNDAVRNAMYTDHTINPEEHVRWIEGLGNDKRQIVFAVIVDGVVSGMVSVNALDVRHSKADWAFYLGQHARGGLGAALEFRFINFAFDHLQLQKLNCEVIETNPKVVELHKSFGFLEEGFRRSNIEKNDTRIGVHFLGLTRQDWVDQRPSIKENFKTLIDRFQITLETPDLSHWGIQTTS